MLCLYSITKIPQSIFCLGLIDTMPFELFENTGPVTITDNRVLVMAADKEEAKLKADMFWAGHVLASYNEEYKFSYIK